MFRSAFRWMLLFTVGTVRVGVERSKNKQKKEYAENQYIPFKVEHSGLEPLTSTLPVSRSSQMS